MTTYRAHEPQRGRGCYIFCHEDTKPRRKPLGTFFVRSSCLRAFVVAFLVGAFRGLVGAFRGLVGAFRGLRRRPVFISRAADHRTGTAARSKNATSRGSRRLSALAWTRDARASRGT